MPVLPRRGTATFLRHEEPTDDDDRGNVVLVIARCDATGRTFADPDRHSPKKPPSIVYCFVCLAEHELARDEE